MKVLFFGENTRALRHAAMKYALNQTDEFRYGIRKASDFNPHDVEPADAVVIDGDFPEIAAAYEQRLELTNEEVLAPFAKEEPAPQKSDAAERRKARKSE